MDTVGADINIDMLRLVDDFLPDRRLSEIEWAALCQWLRQHRSWAKFNLSQAVKTESDRRRWQQSRVRVRALLKDEPWISQVLNFIGQYNQDHGEGPSWSQARKANPHPQLFSEAFFQVIRVLAKRGRVAFTNMPRSLALYRPADEAPVL